MNVEEFELEGDGCKVAVEINHEDPELVDINATIEITDPGRDVYDVELGNPNIYVSVKSTDQKPLTSTTYYIADKILVSEIHSDTVVVKGHYGNYDAAVFTGETPKDDITKEEVEICMVERNEEAMLTIDHAYLKSLM